MPYFIYILKLKSPFDKQANWTDETNATLQAHWNYLVDLHQKGLMKVVGRTDVDIESDANTGIAIFVAENETAARQIMDNDPCIKNGVMQATLSPFNFALGAF